MKIEIISWKSKNLRGYLRDSSVDLGKSPSRWSLIQMPNGTGKTTTMSLLRAAFSGRNMTASEIRALKADDLVEDGFFALDISIDGDPWRIEIKFDFRSEQSEFVTTSIGEKAGGTRPGHDLPYDLKDALRNGLTHLFIFDGEMASAITTIGKDQADKAIRGLYQLDKLSEMESDTKERVKIRQRRAADISAAATQNAIDRFRAELEEAQECFDSLSAKEKSLTGTISSLKTQIENTQKLLDDSSATDEQLHKDLVTARELKKTHQADVSTHTTTCLNTFRTPPLFHEALAQRLLDLGGTLQKRKLPRTTSREFFRELANAQNCICDRPISKLEEDAIRRNADEYLGEDEILVINRMRDALHQINETTQKFSHSSIALHSARTSLRQAEQTEQRLQEELNENASDHDQKLREQLKDDERRLTLAQDELFRLAQPDIQNSEITWKANLPKCALELERRIARYDTTLGTYDFTQKANIVCNLLAQIRNSAQKKLRERIRTTTNNYLETILPNEPLRVSSIDGSLRLNTDEIAEKEGVSEGQKLAVSYAFLTALLHNAPHQFPFIVDSPAVSLDSELRRTVGMLIPELFDQMVMFVISSEREGFAEAFYNRGNVKYITISVDKFTSRASILDGVDAFKAFHGPEGA